MQVFTPWRLTLIVLVLIGGMFLGIGLDVFVVHSLLGELIGSVAGVIAAVWLIRGMRQARTG
jgi:hypothetical protein